jgi:hypothetical protein
MAKKEDVRRSLLVFFGFVLSLAVPAQALVIPDGWKSHRKGPVQTLAPPDAGFWAAFHDEEPMGGKGFAAWFEAQAAADITKRGTLVRKNAPKPTSQGVLLMAADVKEPGGHVVRMVYTGVEFGGNAARFIVVRAQAAQDRLQPLMAEVSKMVAQLSAEARNAKGVADAPAGTPSDSVSGSSRNKGPVNVAPGASAQAAATPVKPGGGVRASDIEAVVHDGEGVYEVDGYRFKEWVWLLLKDGTAYRGLTAPPEHFDPGASRRSEPGKWSQWRKQGARYSALDPKTRQWRLIENPPVRPLPHDGRLNRKLIYRDAYGSGAFGATVFTKEFRFFPNGRFERVSGSLSGTGTVQASGGYSGSSASTQDKTGRHGAASGTLNTGPGEPTVTTGSTSKSRAGAGDMTGTYTINGLTLELRCDSGRVERLLVFYPDPKSDDIFIGRETYYPPL